MKIYSEIKIIEMATNNDVYNIVYLSTTQDVNEGLNNEMADGVSLADAVELCGYYTTKAEAMAASEDAEIQGYGKYSGRKLWQLPTKLQADIKRQMKPRVER